MKNIAPHRGNIVNKKTSTAQYTVCVCLGARCSEFGGRDILRTFEEKLSLKDGETRTDGVVHIQAVCCMGSCPTGVNVMVNEDHYPDMSPTKVAEVLDQYEFKGDKALSIGALCSFCQAKLAHPSNPKALQIKGRKNLFSLELFPSKIEYPSDVPSKNWSCPHCSMPLADGTSLCEDCNQDLITLETEEGKNLWICPGSQCQKWGWE